MLNPMAFAPCGLTALRYALAKAEFREREAWDDWKQKRSTRIEAEYRASIAINDARSIRRAIAILERGGE
jgi:hypothetical protein